MITSSTSNPGRNTHPPVESGCRLTQMPVELIRMILRETTPRTLVHAQKTCRYLQEVVKADRQLAACLDTMNSMTDPSASAYAAPSSQGLVLRVPNAWPSYIAPILPAVADDNPFVPRWRNTDYSVVKSRPFFNAEVRSMRQANVLERRACASFVAFVRAMQSDDSLFLYWALTIVKPNLLVRPEAGAVAGLAVGVLAAAGMGPLECYLGSVVALAGGPFSAALARDWLIYKEMRQRCLDHVDKLAQLDLEQARSEQQAAADGPVVWMLPQ